MNSPERLRIELRAHGFVSGEALLRVPPEARPLIDLASGVSPYAAPEPVLDALRNTGRELYPDPHASCAREAIARSLGTSPERILLGNGAFDLLWTCGRTLVQPGQRVLSVMPGPRELAAAARASGARVAQWRAVERSAYAVDLEQIAELMRLEPPALVDLCAPASPSGAPVRFADVLRLAERFEQTLFVVDQVLLGLSEQHAEHALSPADNVVCVRSFGKELGLPGVRAGYLWSTPQRCALLERSRPSYATSSEAQAVARAAASQREHVASVRLRMLEDRTRLVVLLRELGLVPTPSVTSSVLVRVARAAEVADELLTRYGLAVRDCTPYGLPDHLGIAGIPEPHEARVRAALSQVLTRRGLQAGREA
jgi:histidinol-phosphate/aromatic aminotransferase/cobyric acid decarboxylase-like protein